MLVRMGGGRYEVQLVVGDNFSWLQEAASLRPASHDSHSPNLHSSPPSHTPPPPHGPLPHIAKHHGKGGGKGAKGVHTHGQSYGGHGHSSSSPYQKDVGHTIMVLTNASHPLQVSPTRGH